MNSKLTSYGNLFAYSLLILLIAPSLIQDGMFIDGQQYACVSKNFAEGYGSWWFPYLSETWWKAGSNHFMEHPPLVYWLQGAFFKVLGPSMYTERIYSLLTAFITAFLVQACWKIIFRDRPEYRKLSSLAIVCWIIIPVAFWGYQHNIQENTMGIFTLLSVYLFLLANHQQRILIKYMGLILSGVSIGLAFLCKGPPGLFPLVVVGIFWLSYRSISLTKMLLYTLVLLMSVGLFFGIILMNENAYQSLHFYVEQRLMFRIGNEGVVSNQFSILIRLFMELIPPAALTLVIFFTSRFIKAKNLSIPFLKKEALFFLLLGLAGSLPLMLTPVQRGFYLNPSLPFFGMFLAIIAAPSFLYINNKWKTNKRFVITKKLVPVTLLFAAVIATAMQYGDARRDEKMLADVYEIGGALSPRMTINADPDLYTKWNLKFYFNRYFGISLYCEYGGDYLLIPKESNWEEHDLYKKAPLNTQLYDLYVQKESKHNF